MILTLKKVRGKIVAMSEKRRERIYAVVDSLIPFLNITPAQAFLTIKAMTKDLDEYFEEQPKPKRIHKTPNECTSCEA